MVQGCAFDSPMHAPYLIDGWSLALILLPSNQGRFLEHNFRVSDLQILWFIFCSSNSVYTVAVQSYKIVGLGCWTYKVDTKHLPSSKLGQVCWCEHVTPQTVVQSTSKIDLCFTKDNRGTFPSTHSNSTEQLSQQLSQQAGWMFLFTEKCMYIDLGKCSDPSRCLTWILESPWSAQTQKWFIAKLTIWADILVTFNTHTYLYTLYTHTHTLIMHEHNSAHTYP